MSADGLVKSGARISVHMGYWPHKFLFKLVLVILMNSPMKYGFCASGGPPKLGFTKKILEATNLAQIKSPKISFFDYKKSVNFGVEVSCILSFLQSLDILLIDLLAIRSVWNFQFLAVSYVEPCLLWMERGSDCWPQVCDLSH